MWSVFCSAVSIVLLGFFLLELQTNRNEWWMILLASGLHRLVFERLYYVKRQEQCTAYILFHMNSPLLLLAVHSFHPS